MDEKKLAALYLELKTMGANISIPQEDFIIKMKSRPDYVAKVGKVAKSGSIDFDTYITPISANPFDLMREAVSEKPVAEKEVSPVDYYNQAKPQPHAELVDGEPQNVLGLLSPDKKKLPKQVLQEKVVPNAYEQQMTDVRENLTDAPISEIERSIENKRPEFNETDPIQVGMQQREKRAKEVQSLLPTAKQETTLGFKVNPVDLATKIDPNKVTDIGVTALKYAQEKELPNEIRDAIIGGDDRAVSDYLLLHDDNYRLNYADKQDIAQAESAFKRPVTPQDRMALWQGRTATYAKQDQEKYGEEADWLSPYVMLQKGDNTKLSEKLERIKPLFKNQDGSLYYDEELAKKDVIKESAKLGSFAKPEEKLMAYYQILANRQKTLENLMNQKYSNYAGRSQFELQNPGVSDKPTSGFESALSDLQYGQLMGGALSYIGADFLSRPEAKEWYKNANQLNAIAKYIKKGGAQKDETWGDTFKGVAQDLMAAERYAKGLNVDVISTARQDIGNIQRGVMSQLGIAPTPEEAERLKVQANKGEGLFSADTYIGFAYQQAAIGTQLFLARGMTPTSQVPKLLTPLTNVSKGSTLGKALFSNSLSSKVANKVYSGLIGALGTGIEYQMVGSLSGEEKGSSIRDEMTFGSGVVGSAGKSAAKPFTNWLGKVAGNRIGNAAKRVIQGGASEIAEETPQTIYQAWEQKGGWEGVKEGVEEIIGKDDESTLRRVNKALGFFVSMGLGGYLDGGTSEELYEVMETMIPDVEAASGEKVDKDLLKDILNGMQEGVKDKPVGINVTDNVANFQINGKEFNYTPEGGAASNTEATQEEIEIANKYGKEIIETHEENAPIPQQQEIPAQETPQEAEGQVVQETPEVKTADVPDINVGDIPKTAEELDARRNEINTTLSSNVERVEKLRSEIDAINKNLDPLSDDHDEMIDLLSEKENELSVIQGESESLAAEDNDIAEQRKTVRTEKEAFDDRVAEIDNKIAENTGNIEALKAQYQEATTIDDKKAISAEMKALKGENEALGKEKESMQPKVEAPTSRKTRQVEEVAKITQENDIRDINNRPEIKLEPLLIEKKVAETPIMAETPQLETPISESKGEINPAPTEKVENLQNMTTLEESVTEKTHIEKTAERLRGEQKAHITYLEKAIKEGGLSENDTEFVKYLINTAKKVSKLSVQESQEISDFISDKIEDKGGKAVVTTWKTKDGVVEIRKGAQQRTGLSWYEIYHNGELVGKTDDNFATALYTYDYLKGNKIPTQANTDGQIFAPNYKLRQEFKPQEKETPVAPAAPKEEKPQPEKGESKRKPKTEPPKPPATQKEPTTIKPVNSGSELAEMLGNTEQAIETGKVWDRVAKMWAKKTGKTIEDWWDRIESIQVGGEGIEGGLNQIIGEKGAANLSNAIDTINNLSVAKEMQAAGKDAKTIWLATGWEYNKKEGKWKMEIADIQPRKAVDRAKFSEAVKAKKRIDEQNEKGDFDANIDSEIAAIKALYEDLGYNYYGSNRDIYRAIGDATKNNDSSLLPPQRIASQIDKFSDIRSDGAARLSDIVDGKELFEAYPELKNIKVEFEMLFGGTQAAWNPRTKTITISGNLRPYDSQIQSSLVHEIQHAIQDIEGFAKGGNVQSASKLDKDTIIEIESVASEIRTAKKLKDSGDWLYKSSTIEDIINAGSAESNVKSWAINVVKDGDRAIEDFLKSSPTQQYKALAGEVEARNVQTRLNMSEIERAKKSLSETEDVAEEDKIYLNNTLNQAAKGSVKFENDKFKVFLASDRDISTPVHELAHIFQTDLSESEKKSVVAWYNKGNKTNHKVTDWGFAENETSRNISEYFAEGFVEWLKEGGKTTDKAMQSIFEKFKGWLKDVVNTVFDAKVELNDDMRAIYEQIFTEKEKEEIEKNERPISAKFTAEKNNLDAENRRKDIENLKAGDFIYIPKSDKSSGLTGFVRKVNPKSVEVEVTYGGWGGQDVMLQTIKANKANIESFYSPKKDNTLYQADPYHKQLEDWVISEVTADELAQDPKEARDFVFEYIEPYVGKDVANEIIDRAFNRILYPITDAEKKLSEHADKIEAKAEAVRAVEMESLPQAQIDELREVAKKEGETITDSTTQEERIEIRNRLIDDFVGKGMTQQAAEQLVGQYIRERSFGSKFREKYAPQMSKELRDAVMDKTYLYGVVSNASAIQKAQALVNDWYEKAIEQAANEWSDKADPKNEDFVADTYEKLMDVINNELFGSKVTTDYYVKVAAALYATKLADTLVGNLKGNAKTRVIDKLVTLVGQLAELGNIFGRTINMFGVMTNVKGGVLQAIFNKEMSAVIANMSKTQKTAKDAIESVINGVSDMVEGLKSGSDKGLLQDLADAMQNNPAIDRLLEKIVQNATNEQDIIDILDKIDGLEADKTALEKEIKDKKILEEKIKEKNKEIATLKRKLADKPVKTPTKKAEAQKAAVKTKYESLIDDVVSFGKNLFQNKLYQAIEGFESTLLDTYKEEVINKVNDVMKNITDYVYLGNENASPTKLYEMIQDAARKEFAQKYLEKADIQPEIPINTNPNLSKTEEARNEAARKKNAEKAAQKQLHTDILDAIDNNKFKASIEQYIQENREKDIRNQMRKRVVGVVNNTEITEKDKKVELRKALAQMVAEAATSTNEAAKGIKDFMRTYFDVGGKDVSEFEQEFDRLWEAQVKRKQQELIKKRLQTSDEKEQKLTDKAVAELLENLEKDKEFGHKFMEDLAKNVRITQGNWEAETAKRFREHYHIPLLTQANQKKIADMIKYVDSLPNDSDAKQGAMDVIMTEYLNIVGIENIDRWVSLIDVMFHVNNLLNIGTQWQNIKDSLYQVLHDLALPVANFMGEVVTAMRDRKPFGQALSIAQRSNLINAKTVWKTLFSQSTYRLIYNQFSVKEARAIGEYSSFMDYFAKNFAELPRKLKGFQFKSALDFIQYGTPAGLMTLYDGVPLSTITNALLSGFDMALGNTLQMGRMANILSRKGIASQEAIDLADISKAGSRRMEYNGKMQTIDEILTDERGKGYFAKQEQIVDMWNKAIAEGKTEAEAHEVIKEAVRNGDIQSEYKREWRRKMQLFADYVEQEHAAWIIADTYRKNATYKNDPTGVLGWIYNGVNTALVRNLRQSEIEAREAYKKDKTFTNLRKQKWAQLLKIGAERILGTAYFRTKINIFNKQKLNSFFGSLITAIKNYVPYMDTEAAMKLAINKKGELKPNSLWYVDDLVNKGFLSEAKKKVQTDIDNIAGTATANKEKVTKREDTQIEKIDNQIADKEKTLSEKIESIDKFSTQKQDAIDRKIDKRQDIVAAFSEKIQAIQDLFSNKEQKILDDTQAAIEKLESKIVQIEINAVDKISAKNAKIESKINQYVHKRERIYLQTLLIDKRIESETSDFESAILQLKEQEKAISKGLNKEDKQKLADFVDKKQQQIADLHGKRLAELNKQKGIKVAQMQEAITLFEFQLENYKNIYESSIDYIERDVQRAVEAAEIAIQKATSNLDEKIAENNEKKEEAAQKAKEIFSKRIASLDFELNVAINVEKERYDRQKAYLQRVFDTDKAKLEAEKKLIADRAKAERANIDDLAKTKSTPLSQDITKIDKRIASHNESYRIGVADETARRFRIAGVNALIGTSAFLFLKAILAGDADDEDEPFIDVVGDITPAEGGTKTQNQNQKEANSKKKIIIRAFGQQMSFNFASFTMIQDLLAWGEVFDYLREKKKGIVSDKSIGDVVLRPILTSYQQALAFRDAETLNFMDKFTEPSERVVRIAANLSPIKVPAQAKQIISDFYYGGQQYAYPENEAYFQQYLRMIGAHPELISTEQNRYAKQYSVIDGQPLYRYAGDNTNEVNRLLSTGIWGKETATSFNEFTIKPDRFNVLYKEMEFKKWLYDRGLTDAINITNPKDVVPKVADNILLGLDPLPQDEFQENIVKPTAMQASDKLREMYKSGDYNGKSKDDIIEKVKTNTMGEEVAKEYLKSDRSNEAAFNIGLKYIVKDIWEGTQKEVLGAYLETKPRYKLPTEKTQAYKDRLELK